MARIGKQKQVVDKSDGGRLVGNVEGNSAALFNEPTKLKTLRNDALIARLAVMHDGFVVTYDVDDFQIIQRVMPRLQVIAAQEFFDY